MPRQLASKIRTHRMNLRLKGDTAAPVDPLPYVREDGQTKTLRWLDPATEPPADPHFEPGAKREPMLLPRWIRWALR